MPFYAVYNWLGTFSSFSLGRAVLFPHDHFRQYIVVRDDYLFSMGEFLRSMFLVCFFLLSYVTCTATLGLKKTLAGYIRIV